MQKSLYILVCASVRTCDDPLESSSLFDKMVQFVNKIEYIQCIDLFHLRILGAHFGELRTIMFAHLKHSS